MSLLIVTEENSPYEVPAGKRVIHLKFVGAMGGGTVTITPAGASANDPVVLSQDEEFELDLPVTGTVPHLGGTSTIAWTGIDHYRLVLV